MSIQNLFNQFLGTAGETSSSTPTHTAGIGQHVSNLSSKIPGGLVGGAAAGGIMALLVSNKSARKLAGKAATYGGAAMLGGLAYKAYQNYRHNSNVNTRPTELDSSQSQNSFHQQAISSAHQQQDSFELTLMKAMIAAAKADGHIDAQEQQRIFQAVEKMDLSAAEKGLLFDCLQQDIPIDEITSSVSSIELKSEIYLASCLVIEPDHAAEREYLDRLATTLELPEELAFQLEQQAHHVLTEAA